MEHNHHIATQHRLTATYKGKRVELSSNIATMELAERLKTNYSYDYPELKNIEIEEYDLLIW